MQLLWDGYTSEGEQRYYTSIEQACRLNKELSAILSKHSVKARMLLAHMRVVGPACRPRREEVKRLLADPWDYSSVVLSCFSSHGSLASTQMQHMCESSCA